MNAENVVRVEGLRVEAGPKPIVAGIGFTVDAGRILAIVGASGSGKTTVGSALLDAVRLHATGTVEVDGVDMLAGPRGRLPVAHLPQQPAAVLNPVRRIGGILADLAKAAGRPPGAADEALRRAGLDPALMRRFPHRLSGGQQQRLVLAHAFLGGARLLVADEPTTGQDPANRDRIAAELRAASDGGLAVVLLSHDLDLVEAIADHTAVLASGAIVEHRPTADLFAAPEHPHTRRLLAARTATPGPHADPGAPVRLEARGLTVRARRAVLLGGASFTLRRGECVAVTGPSGSGKTTLGRAVAGLRTAAGTLLLDGVPLPLRERGRTRAERARVQYVFQDARASFDERRPILDQVARTAVRLRGMAKGPARAEAGRLLAETGLPLAAAARRPGGLSGGQLQRAALSRALAARPEVLVCDEITSGLDAPAAAGVLDLLAALKAGGGMAIVLITHERSAADRLADRVLRVEEGRLR
ncbi:ABC transporter ATP-binding protein [Glycomyces paridis]|uniref:ABC transporter ATP-binding protein n=1 Tax=Glycomyces paridis TaxID=2126555 RepID=A0A4S8PDP1_9ACTN|nr:ATP-binding cassette domain-containing protein [Glycomyces paridis]THV26434.1 ABC transporter ATP-binding protein [Glycomyces paridis]